MTPDDLNEIVLQPLPPYDPPPYDPLDFRAEMRREKAEYDAEMDFVYRYEADVIEKGIRDQAEDRARDYLSKNGDAVWARVAAAIQEAEALVEEHPIPSLVLSMTAAELMVRFMLLRPMLAGLVIDPEIADRLASVATRGFGGRDRELLPHVCRAWGIDLSAVRVGETREIWPTLGMLSSERDDALHRGAAVAVADAHLALTCISALSKEVLGQLVAQLRMKWPDGQWLARSDEPIDPLAKR